MADTKNTTEIKYVKDEPVEKRLYGRQIIYADYKAENLTKEDIEKILNDKFYIHEKNAQEIDYLYNYYKGKQPILGKTKVVREEINNIVVENNALFAVEFKKGYVFGEPIQYVQRGDVANNQVAILNSYMTAEQKHSKDSDLAEWLYIAGIGTRMVLAEADNEDSPFTIYNLDPRTTFKVYENDVGNKELFGCTYFVQDNGTKKGSIYTKNKVYEFTGDLGKFKVTEIENEYKGAHILGRVPIFEYQLNKSRLGILEIILSMANALNQISSDDLDGLDQFIQSLVVFVNNDVDAETFKQLMALGAVKVKSENASLPADVKLLVNELNHSNTKVVYDRIYNNMLTIIGVPTSKKTTSGGDTGQAVQLSEGWEMANDRAKQDEEAFKATATEELKLILRICEKAPASGINNLKVKDIDIKFTRHKLDNLLVKSQAFLNMIKGGMALDCALIISGLCSDPNEVYLKSLEFYGGLEKWIEYFTDGKATESNENNNNGKEE